MVDSVIGVFSSGPARGRSEGELLPAPSPDRGRAQQLRQTLQLQQHEGKPDGQLHSGPRRDNGPKESSLHEERWGSGCKKYDPQTLTDCRALSNKKRVIFKGYQL